MGNSESINPFHSFHCFSVRGQCQAWVFWRAMLCLSNGLNTPWYESTADLYVQRYMDLKAWALISWKLVWSNLVTAIGSDGKLMMAGTPCPRHPFHQMRWTTTLAYMCVGIQAKPLHSVGHWVIQMWWIWTGRDEERVSLAVSTAEILQE